MDTSAGPAQIAAQLGAIEDEIAEAQNEHARLNGVVKRKEKFMETFLATLYEMVDPLDCAGAQERMTFAKAELHKSEEYTEFLDELEQLEQARKNLEYLDIRRSIGQSILRRGYDQGDDPRYGQEARGQAGTGID